MRTTTWQSPSAAYRRGEAAVLEEQGDQGHRADDQETPDRHQHRGHRGQASTDQPPHLMEIAGAGSGT